MAGRLGTGATTVEPKSASPLLRQSKERTRVKVISDQPPENTDPVKKLGKKLA